MSTSYPDVSLNVQVSTQKKQRAILFVCLIPMVPRASRVEHATTVFSIPLYA